MALNLRGHTWRRTSLSFASGWIITVNFKVHTHKHACFPHNYICPSLSLCSFPQTEWMWSLALAPVCSAWPPVMSSASRRGREGGTKARPGVWLACLPEVLQHKHWQSQAGGVRHSSGSGGQAKFKFKVFNFSHFVRKIRYWQVRNFGFLTNIVIVIIYIWDQKSRRNVAMLAITLAVR